MASDHRPSRLVWVLGLLVLLASTAGTAWYLGPWSSKLTTPPLPATSAQEDVVAQGHVDVRQGVIVLHPSQPGRVVKIEVPEGQSVSKADMPLLYLDNRLAILKCAEARAAYQAAQAQLELTRKLGEQHAVKGRQQDAAIKIAEQNQRSAEADFRRQKKLHEGKAIPDEVLAIADAQVERARGMVEAEKARREELQVHSLDAEQSIRRVDAEVAVAKARLDQAQLALDECVIRSPCAGKVLRLQVGVGDLLTAQPLQPAVSFLPDEPLVVRAEVHQEDVGRVQVGDAAEIHDDSGVDTQTWHGEVAYVADWLARRRSVLLEPGQLNDVRTLECIIKLTDSKPGLRIGQRVRVHIRPTVKGH